jgi:ABC-type transport system substrate-binding protein
VEKMKVEAQLIIFCLLIGITFALVPYQSLAQTSDHDTLIIGIEEIEYIDPRPEFNEYFAIGLSTSAVYCQYMAALGMLTPGDSSDVIPGLAKSWTHNENFTEWTYTLREGLMFHDETPVDARAIEYSMYANYLVAELNPYTGVWPSNFSSVKETFESRGISFSFPETDPTGSGRVITFHSSSPQLYQEWFFGSHFVRGFIVPYGSHGEYNDSAETCKSKIEHFFEHPVSAGPYIFKEWIKDDYVLLERFNEWFGWGQTFTSIHGKDYTFPTKERAFKSIKFKMFPYAADFKTELLSGNIDVIYSEYYTNIDNATFETFPVIDQTDGFSVHSTPMVMRAEIGINIQGNWPTMFGGPGNFPVSETWFRQAVSHALDREKMIEVAYKGYGFVSDSLFHPDVETHFPDIDTSDYYDFDQGLAMAESILDSHGYTALGFSEELNNRFGYGLYLNETTDQGETRNRGHHFRMISTTCPSCDVRSELIVENLEEAGIYVDLEILDWDTFRKYVKSEPGVDYNTSYPEEVRDPNYNGSEIDFMVYGFRSVFGFPHTYVGGYWGLFDGYSNWQWYWDGSLPNSWFNNEYEVLLAKMKGDYGFLEWVPYAVIPLDAPYPLPEVRNNDTQYTEACEDAGELLSKELPFIPLVWYPTLSATNNHVKNFLVDGYDQVFHGAYAYWEPDPKLPSSTPTSTTSSIILEANSVLDYFLLINICLILLVYWSKKKKK